MSGGRLLRGKNATISQETSIEGMVRQGMIAVTRLLALGSLFSAGDFVPFH